MSRTRTATMKDVRDWALPFVVLITLTSAILFAGFKLTPAHATDHVYSNCFVTRYEYNQLTKNEIGSDVVNEFDCQGETISQGGGQKVVDWDSDYWAPDWGWVQVVMRNDVGPGTNWRVVGASACKGGGGGNCLPDKPPF